MKYKKYFELAGYDLSTWIMGAIFGIDFFRGPFSSANIRQWL